ncbi:MAG TPA: alpha-amylase family glycosyl hydrolase [Myxococcales bacterium]|nr:alpha-amylase family glycosyl hydrolase [Myxococcales bacterium]
MRTRPLLLVLLVACNSAPYTHLYQASPIAPSYTVADVAAMNHMGATVVDDGVNFAVYSEHATKMQVLLFDDPVNQQLPTRQFDLTPVAPGANVWNVFVSGVGLHQAYGYIAWGPNWPYVSTWQAGAIDGFQADVDANGNRFDPNKLLLDPWAKMMTANFDWSIANAPSGPDRTQSTYQAAGKSLTVQSQYQWSDAEAQWIAARQNPNMPGHRLQDLIVYEMHPKGFTADASSGVIHPGTFRGIGENADYLKDLGITALELLPSEAKSTDGGYWGYDTIGFFIPELTYTALLNPSSISSSILQNPEAPIDEFKWMVDQLHQRGIEVFLDVVFNHTGEGGLWQDEIQLDDVVPDGDPALYNYDPKEVANILEWRGLDNQAWYALDPTNQFYWDNSGVGQDTRPNHTPMARLIMDSLNYWVSEMHVDGFRFDEAAILGQSDQIPYTWANPPNPSTTILQTIADDPLFHQQNIRIVAEPWSGGGDWNGYYPASTTLPGYGWGEWNGPFRDWWRSAMNVPGWNVGSTIWSPITPASGATAGFFLDGSYDFFEWNGRLPGASFNFVTIHDGFTMYDLFSYDTKVNGCGPLNPACCTGALNYYCSNPDGADNNISFNWNSEDQKRQLMRNLFVAMLVSHGTPLLLGGDEWMRTQLGNNNAYSTLADNYYNWFEWGTWEADPHRQRMHDFVKQLIALRKKLAYALAPGDWSSGAPLSWEGTTAGQPPNWNGQQLAVHYPPSSQGPELDILINLATSAADFTLPAGSWVALLDTQQYFDADSLFTENAALDPGQSNNVWLSNPTAVPGGDYNVMPQSIVVLENGATAP